MSGLRFAAPRGAVLHHVIREGRGRPVVFVNSLGTDLRIWQAVVAGLDPEMPVLLWDKRGHGLSEEGETDMAGHAADLAGLMDLHGLSGALVCGVSVGGMIAQALAADRPDLVAGLMLSNTGHRIGDAATWNARIEAVEQGGIAAISEPILERWLSPGYRAENPEMLAGWRMMLTRTPAAGYAAICRAIRDADLTEAARGIDVPTLCLAGSVDGATPPALVEELAALVSGAEYRCLEGIGHLPCIERPDEVAALIRDMLGRIG
ncbi:3-oxoadipate enol-lactonase [Limimaricola sp. G21655-S1]|uniref:3-oxoadipate enol-lactonase n=1 Tax=Limimaricola sp. G21655-S1 TaxID=3014768 RepID=UPI0022AFE371|nr:3-oxoadipate enol-lactonase [Limimaricola sp. G21655-S1]MCZ4260639.1 3-oxoadipate enol-lactonase [Limimaricola sp. G21655-S1]